MMEIHWERKQENVKVRTFIQPLINNQNENQRMYEVVKNINKMGPKQPIVIKSNKEGLTTNGETQAKAIAKYFTDIFWKDVKVMPDLQPTEMSNTFTSDEIKKAMSKMKMNKSPGCDEILIELIMCTPDCVFMRVLLKSSTKLHQMGIVQKKYHCKNLGNQEDQHQTSDQSFSCLRYERYLLSASWTKFVAD